MYFCILIYSKYKLEEIEQKKMKIRVITKKMMKNDENNSKMKYN